MGHYDLPATLDYMTEITGVEKAAYIGHSQGTTQMFVGLIDLEDYFKDKISVFIALAPVTMIPNTETKIFTFAAQFYDELDDAAKLFGIHSILNKTWYTTDAVLLFCKAVP
jgi:pimeloyl-ACP methyl ester carboxylesterase